MAETIDLDLLYLYDADMNWLQQSSPRRNADLAIGVKGGVKGLVALLDQFLKERKTFKRVMFETHGRKGMISFGKEQDNRQIDSETLLKTFSGYDALFPEYTRIYFSGCNVADDEVGWQFLETANKVFCSRGGGTTFGWTSKGLAVGSNLLDILGVRFIPW